MYYISANRENDSFLEHTHSTISFCGTSVSGGDLAINTDRPSRQIGETSAIGQCHRQLLRLAGERRNIKHALFGKSETRDSAIARAGERKFTDDDITLRHKLGAGTKRIRPCAS